MNNIEHSRRRNIEILSYISCPVSSFPLDIPVVGVNGRPDCRIRFSICERITLQSHLFPIHYTVYLYISLLVYDEWLLVCFS